VVGSKLSYNKVLRLPAAGRPKADPPLAGSPVVGSKK